MTRNELLKELTKLDRCIEIYKVLISKPLCNCITHIEEKYKESNKRELAYLLGIQNLLIPLKDKSDEALGYIVYKPVNISC